MVLLASQVKLFLVVLGDTEPMNHLAENTIHPFSCIQAARTGHYCGKVSYLLNL